MKQIHSSDFPSSGMSVPSAADQSYSGCNSGPEIGSSGCLELYCADIASYHALSREEEFQTALKAANGDPDAKNSMFFSGLHLVVFLARQIRTPAAELMDLIQEGNIGLMTAVEKYDTCKNVRFSTYAKYWILQSMQQYLYRNSLPIRLPSNISVLQSRIRTCSNAFYMERGRSPDPAELSELLHLPLRQLLRACCLFFSYTPGDAALPGGDRCCWDLLAETEPQDPLRSLQQQELSRLLQSAISECLTARESEVLDLRYGLSSGRSLCQKDTAGRLGISKERVSQLESNALRKLYRSRYAARLSEYLCTDI